jgi:hypothetical protein
MVRLFPDRATLFPPEGKKVITEWLESYRRYGKDFRESVDQSFKNVEIYFVDSSKSLNFVYHELEGIVKTNAGSPSGLQNEKAADDSEEPSPDRLVHKYIAKRVVRGRTGSDGTKPRRKAA